MLFILKVYKNITHTHTPQKRKKSMKPFSENFFFKNEILKFWAVPSKADDLNHQDLHGVPVYFLLYIKTTKTNLGRKGFFFFVFFFGMQAYYPSSMKPKEEHGGRNCLRDHEGTLLITSLPMAYSATFVYSPSPHSQRWHHPQ